MTQEQIKKVFDMLSTNEFWKWYLGEFTAFLDGEEDSLSKEEILEWLTTKIGALDNPL
jgi:hypothetical protein